MQLFYTRYCDGRAPGQKPALFILHGLFGASGNWHTLAKNVFSRVADVYTVDQRNHGRSPHDDSFTYKDMVDDLEHLMDSVDIASASVLGHSMGGKTAMHFALDHPERVDKLIIVDVAPVAYPDRHQYIFNGLRDTDVTQFASRDEIDSALSQHIPSAGVRQFLMKNLVRKNGTFAWANNVETVYHAYDDLNAPVTGWPPFTGETLFIRGDRSDYIRDEDVPAILALFPAAELITIRDSGHWVHAENKTDFATAVLSFLS